MDSLKENITEKANRIYRTLSTEKENLMRAGFGGIYLSDDNIVLCTNRTCYDKFVDILSEENNIEFRTVDKTTVELNNIIENNREILGMRKVNGWYVDVYANKLVLECHENFIEQLNILLKDNNDVIIKQDNGLILTNGIYGGDELYNSTSKKIMSVGMCGRYNGQDVVITCGHNNLVNDSMAYNGSYLGKIIYVNPSSGTEYFDGTYLKTIYGDYSIIRVECDVNVAEVSPYVKGSGTLYSIASMYDTIIGTTICAYGRTDGFRYGTVTATGYNKALYYERTDERVLAKNLVKAKCTSSGGDSGGCVYTTLSTRTCQMVGLITGMANDEQMVYSPISYVRDKGVTLL